ncbi:hypothetical protein ACRAKI_22420 [Saccharothrix isguenensis]
MTAMDCAFCVEFADPGETNRIIVEEDGWVLLPTIGSFTPGYCLYMPLEHVDAAADLPVQALSKAQAAVEGVRSRITSAFGPTIVAEHGSRDCELGAGCCTHCHLHLIPVPITDAVTTAYRATGGDATVLSGLAGLPAVATGPYLYLSPEPGQHLYWPADTRFARQYVRRVCAKLHGLADQYDWRDHRFDEHQRYTLEVLRGNTSTAADRWQATC